MGGVKYDYMPIFTGPQGIGKSTFLAVLGKEWFSDSPDELRGKGGRGDDPGDLDQRGRGVERLQQAGDPGHQTVPEQKDDIYRAAYGKRTDKYPRRCVFFGTSNDGEFLKDATGNRRFWPVDVGVYPAKKSVWGELPLVVDQVWAEAYLYWKLGEPLYLPKEIEPLAQEQQEAHREQSGKEGMIREFLARKIPSDGSGMTSRKGGCSGVGT